jgi:hypothetical protein
MRLFAHPRCGKSGTHKLIEPDIKAESATQHLKAKTNYSPPSLQRIQLALRVHIIDDIGSAPLLNLERVNHPITMSNNNNNNNHPFEQLIKTTIAVWPCQKSVWQSLPRLLVSPVD